MNQRAGFRGGPERHDGTVDVADLVQQALFGVGNAVLEGFPVNALVWHLPSPLNPWTFAPDADRAAMREEMVKPRNDEPIALQEWPDRSNGVVVAVFVINHVKRASSYHLRKILHFKHQRPVILQQPVNPAKHIMQIVHMRQHVIGDDEVDRL